MGNRTFRVMIRKTVQVRQYEPTVIELSCEGEVDSSKWESERDEAYLSLKAKMNDIFEPKKTMNALD